MAQKYSLFIIILVLIAGCKSEATQISKVPVISISSVEQLKLNGRDSVVNITLAYEDGDGDIGLNTQDTLVPYNYGSKYFYNLLVNLYRVKNGKAAKIPIPLSSDTINFNDRITNLTPTGKSKSISGEIRLFIKAIPYPGVLPDSMYYTFQLIDRKLNESNIVQTKVLRFVF